MTDPVRRHEAAQAAVDRLLAALAADDWQRPTACDGWTVTDVVRHLLAGERAFTTSLGGDTYDLAAIRDDVAEVPREALPAALDDATARLRAAAAAADPAGRFYSPLGPSTPAEVVDLRTVELLAHGLDVARAVGHDLVVADDVVEPLLDAAQTIRDRVPADREAFGPPQPAAAGAPALVRLAALLGRAP